MPGEGIGWFLVKKEEFKSLSKKRKREIVQAELQRIYAYGKWRQVLRILSLKPTESDFSNQVTAASSYKGGGESKEHKRLKEFVAKNPDSIGLPVFIKAGRIEYALSSGDSIDVFFIDGKTDVAVEVKSKISNESDISRGIFQCVKYKAVLEAMQAATGKPQNARAILVLGGTLPSNLLPIANVLGVEVIESVHHDG